MKIKTLIATTILLASTNAFAYNFTTNTPENGSSSEMFIDTMQGYEQQRQDRSDDARESYRYNSYESEYRNDALYDILNDDGEN